MRNSGRSGEFPMHPMQFGHRTRLRELLKLRPEIAIAAPIRRFVREQSKKFALFACLAGKKSRRRSAAPASKRWKDDERRNAEARIGTTPGVLEHCIRTSADAARTI